MQLRGYQAQLDTDVHAAWQNGAHNVLAVLPTGAGKTVIFARSLAEHSAMAGMIAGFQTGTSSVAIAHRQELVGQMSVALARCGVRHRIIAPPKTIRQIVRSQVTETGASVYDPNAPCAVAGVDTLIRQADKLAGWAATVGVWVIDEGHHVLTGNKWGRAVEMFPNALGLGVTATATRADRKGLGRHADGVFDELVVGPSGRHLINDGWLVDYRVYSPPSDLDLSDVTIGASGDYSQKKMANAVRRSHIVGDVVAHYQRIAYGRLGVAFVPDVQTASDTAARFQQAGIPAESISAKTPSHVRDALIARYRRREILVLVNVDLFGEGFDLPALEVVMMARPTESFPLYCQQFGRALRPSVPGLNELPDASARLQAIADSEKPKAIIIDHVGNVVKFSKTWGLPDAPQNWTLHAGGRRSRGSDDAIPLRACVNPECNAVYERFYPACPHCGSRPVPAERSAPEHVDGDLTELDPNVLAAMRGEVENVDKDPEQYRAELQQKHAPKVAEHTNVKHHRTRQEMQRALRTAMAWWAGHHRARGRSDAESYRRFYHAFGVDALSAQALDVKDAVALADRINERIIRGIE